MAFNVGQHVECIRDGSETVGFVPPINKGSVYTVKALWSNPIGGQCMVLEGGDPPMGHGYDCFDPTAFRPVNPAKIAIFTSMLNSVPKEVVV
jgi:hypothetical protein